MHASFIQSKGVHVGVACVSQWLHYMIESAFSLCVCVSNCICGVVYL